MQHVTIRPIDAPSGPMHAMAAAFIGLIVVGALYVGQDIFVPLALAILLSFVLAPLAELLQRLHFPRTLSVISVVVIAFALLLALGTLMGRQLTQLAGDLPRYETTIRQKIHAIKGASSGDSTFERAADVLRQLGAELDRPAGSGGAPAASAAPQASPVPVIVRSPDAGPLATIVSLITPLLHPLAITGLIIIFVIFILMQREDIRNRLIRLAGTRDIQRTTAALDDAGARLSRFFLMQLGINCGFGVAIGLGLWAIGVPSPLLWGIFAAVLRFLPYIGSVIAAVFPLALAAAVDPGWTMLIATGLLFLIVEPLVGHIIEPIFQGHSTGMSPVAVVLSASFWTVLWGPIGLVLATPLTACLVVLGRHVEGLAFINILFGDEPALEPWELFYQRMLAGDASEAVEQAEEVLEERRLLTYYQNIALEGLKLAQIDLAAGKLTGERIETIREGVEELVEDLAEFDDSVPVQGDDKLKPEAAAAVAATPGAVKADKLPFVDAGALAGAWRAGKPILCIAARSPLDEAAAVILADLLGKHGLGARAEGVDILTTSNIARFDFDQTALIVLSALDGESRAHLRNVCRRIRRRAPAIPLVVAAWGAPAGLAEAIKRECHADMVAVDLRGVVEKSANLAVSPVESAKENAPAM
jgi:predicted PurR-regulated permease PerM